MAPSYKASESVTLDSLRVEVVLGPEREAGLTGLTAGLGKAAWGEVLDALAAEMLELMHEYVVHIYQNQLQHPPKVP